MNEYVNNLESKVGELSNRLEKSSSIIDITATITPVSNFSL